MSEPEKFLTRWSRRKLDAEEPVAPAVDEAALQTPAADGETPSDADNKAPPPAPAFDPASLPPLDSIGAETDISAFLKAGVPGDLRLAALRRAWLSDPAIRDFKGLAENDWDFTIPNAQMGFGDIDPGLDVKKMLADMFAETPRAEPTAAAELPRATEQFTQPPQEMGPPADRVALNSRHEPPRDGGIADSMPVETTNEGAMVHRDKNAAPQTDVSESEGAPIKRKRHGGGALPQ